MDGRHMRGQWLLRRDTGTQPCARPQAGRGHAELRRRQLDGYCRPGRASLTGAVRSDSSLMRIDGRETLVTFTAAAARAWDAIVGAGGTPQMSAYTNDFTGDRTRANPRGLAVRRVTAVRAGG